MNTEQNKLIIETCEKLEWLLHHNKNYTKKQYYILGDLQENLIKIIEIELNKN